jgi:TPR repeat protein
MPNPFDNIYSLEDKIKYANFLEGDLDEVNYGEYLSLLEECANAGSEDSAIKLSEIYKYGDAFTEADEKAAIETLKIFFSKSKSSKTAKEIAEIYWLMPYGTEADSEADSEAYATEWYKISADLGDGESCERLAQRYWHGWGCDENIDDAIRYYELAIGYKYTPANLALATLYLDDFEDTKKHKEAIKLLQDGSIQDDAKCQFLYASYLESGEYVAQDDKQAFLWLSKSAAQDNPEAQYKLATNYLTGKGVDEDIYTAFKWFERSAENHYQKAQIQLYTSYLCGSGIEKNLTLSFAWLLIAIKNSWQGSSKDLLSTLVPMSHLLGSTLNKDQISRATKFRDEFVLGNKYRYS